MIKRLLTVLVVAALATGAASQGVHAQGGPPPPPQSGDDNTHYGWADVLRVDPVYGVARTVVPQQDCYDQTVVQQAPSHGSTAGTLLGAVVGGVLGSTIGHGGGRTAATVAGAVAGGAVGNNVSSQPGGQYTTTQTNCRQVNAVSEQRRIMGYDVEYRYRGEVYMSRLNYDPGERMRVRVNISPAD